VKPDPQGRLSKVKVCSRRDLRQLRNEPDGNIAGHADDDDFLSKKPAKFSELRRFHSKRPGKWHELFNEKQFQHLACRNGFVSHLNCNFATPCLRNLP